MDAIRDEVHSHRKDTDSEEEQVYQKLINYPLEFTNLVKKRFPFAEAIQYENMLIKEFDRNGDSSIDGGTRTKNTYFSYILLDPCITQNLPTKANVCLEKMLLNLGTSGNGGGLLELLDPKLFACFILAIFYVGKGHNARAYQHFYDAFKEMFADLKFPPAKGGGKSTNKMSAKTERICSIWRKGKGAVSLHCFQGICENEALTREALMIEVLSLSNLTNTISGQFRCDLKLNKRQRNILGTYLLFKAFIILLLNGERQVKMPSK